MNSEKKQRSLLGTRFGARFPDWPFTLLHSLFATLILACLATPLLAQQTLQLTQYTFNGLAVNPAYAGYMEHWMLRGGYRLQWTGISGAPKTGTVSIDGTLDPRGHSNGLGVLLTNDRLGPQNTSSAWLNYAFRLRLNEDGSKRFSFGIGAGVTQVSLDASSFVPVDLLDNNLPITDENALAPDLRAGIYYSSTTFYAGLSAINLLGSTVFRGTNAITQERHYYLVTGALLRLSPDFDLKPALLIKDDLKGPTNFDLSNYLALRRTFWIGASYRCGFNLWGSDALSPGLGKQDAFALLTQLYFKERYRFGYSFDFTTGKLAGSQNGTHEISLGISFPQKKERILSPRFF